MDFSLRLKNLPLLFLAKSGMISFKMFLHILKGLSHNAERNTLSENCYLVRLLQYGI